MFSMALLQFLTGAASFYFVFNIYDDFVRSLNWSSAVNCSTSNSSNSSDRRRQRQSIVAQSAANSITATLISSILVAVLAVSVICVVALTTLSPPTIPTVSPSGNNTTIESPTSGRQLGAPELAEAYAAAGLSWMKSIICAVAITSLFPGAILHIRSVSAVVRQMAADGLLMTCVAGKNDDREPACHWDSIVVMLAGSAVIAISSLVCFTSMLVGITSITILAIHLLTVGTALDAIYRPLEAVQRRRRRQPNSYSAGSKPTTRQISATSSSASARLVTSTAVSGLRPTASSASSVLYGTTLSPLQSSVIDERGSSAVLELCSSPDRSAAATGTSSDVGTEMSSNFVDDSDCDSASSSLSSDTDIDAIVDEYHVTRLTVLAHCRQDDALIDVRCPDKKSHRLAVRLLVAYVISVFVFSAVVGHAQIRAWPSGAIFAAVLSLILVILTAALTATYTFFLPRNDDVLTVTSSRTRPQGLQASTTGVRCAALASLAMNGILMALIEQVSQCVALSWIITGGSRD
jgi:hypothetical protein